MLDVRDTPELVVGFRVGEVVFKFLLPGGIRRKGIPRLPLPCGVELDQFPGHVLGGFPGLGLGFLPGIGADLIETDVTVIPAASDVLAHSCRRHAQ